MLFKRGIWNEESHLCLREQRLQYLQTFTECLWAFIPSHPAAVGPAALQLLYNNRSAAEDSTVEHACLAVSVNVALSLGALHMGERKAAQEFFALAREGMSSLFDRSDYAVAIALAQMMIFQWTIGDYTTASYYNTLCQNICRRLNLLNCNANLACLIVNAHSPLLPLEKRKESSVEFWRVQREHPYVLGFDTDGPLPVCIEHVLYFTRFTQTCTFVSVFLEQSKAKEEEQEEGERERQWRQQQQEHTRNSTLTILLASLSQLLAEAQHGFGTAPPLSNYYNFYCTLSIVALQANCHLLLGQKEAALQRAVAFCQQALKHASFCQRLTLTFLPRFRCVLQVFLQTEAFHRMSELLDMMETMSVAVHPMYRFAIDSFRGQLDNGREQGRAKEEIKGDVSTAPSHKEEQTQCIQAHFSPHVKSPSMRRQKKERERLRMQHWFEWKPSGDSFSRSASYNVLVKK
ncbi:hypothetical protein QOT17_016623 [Balamuthia mandrillaris]